MKPGKTQYISVFILGLLLILLESAVGYNYKEIGNSHGISESNIKKQISRFKKSIGKHAIA